MAGRAERPAGAADFDFLIGTWTVHNRMLRVRLAGSTEWAAFDASLDVRPILAGMGQIDAFHAVLPNGRELHAATLRLFAPGTEEWSLYWLDARTAALDTPVVGSFTDGVGSFYAHERFGDRPIVVRFLWTGTEGNAPRWEQAFSEDEGGTWETNWTMEFERRA